MVTPVHVRQSPPGPQEIANPLLTPHERARCAAFRSPLDAARHATGRTLARQTAAACLDVAPDRIGVALGPWGRPLIALDGVPAAWVSISHAGDVVVVAVCHQPCGVDVEEVRSLAPMTASEVAFHPNELAELARLEAPAATQVAARWWTAKEAALKAAGIGMAVSPSRLDARFEVLTVPEVEDGPTAYPGTVSDVDGARSRADAASSLAHAAGSTMSEVAPGPSRWRLRDLATAPGHHASLATPDGLDIIVLSG
ncbi:MAG: 4'-phosphopantetheinyl transferase family protein [Actinomycetales bacterium]